MGSDFSTLTTCDLFLCFCNIIIDFFKSQSVLQTLAAAQKNLSQRLMREPLLPHNSLNPHCKLNPVRLQIFYFWHPRTPSWPYTVCWGSCFLLGWRKVGFWSQNGQQAIMLCVIQIIFSISGPLTTLLVF